MIRSKQQLLNIITNNLEVYEFGKNKVYPLAICKVDSKTFVNLEVVVFKKNDVLKIIDYETFINNMRLRAIFK